MLRSAGDVWAWLLDGSRQRLCQGQPAISNYQALCRQLTSAGPFGELSMVGARSVLRRWRRAHLLQALWDKAERAGILVRLVDERGTSSTCRPADGGSPSPRAVGSAVRTAGSRGTGIWWVPTTSPPRLAADLRARVWLCSSSTVGPVSCRLGVTAAATSTTNGGVGPAWPRAT
jgi:hypothetical protein